MTSSRLVAAILALVLSTMTTGCGSLPGRPGPRPEVGSPGEEMSFGVLYAQNCSGCHGPNGWGGAAFPLADPVYLAIVDDATLRKVVANGIPNSLMPAFARSAGGMLTDQQVNAIVDGMRQRWAKPGVLGGATPPPYAASSPGDPARGAAVYKTFCASCHGPGGKGGAKASSITDGSYLGLVSDQELRTVVICGRPRLGAPDWRNDVPGEPMTAQQISDVVAFLASQRPKFPGQPYPGQKTEGGK
jgi:cytochrome c oxidase cbb3-type subunit III